MGSGISTKMEAFMERASWIRKMFEEGARLKAEHGPDRVADLSLGNPDIAPPEEFEKVLREEASLGGPGRHGYMPNAGYPEVRAEVAKAVSKEQGVEMDPEGILMTCGAAGGLNCIFKAVLDPGDEVVVPSPFFVEYGFYVDNHGGVLVPVDTKADFSLDLDRIASALGERTKAVLINSPNNPTGVVYREAEIEALAGLLREHTKRLGRPVWLVSDEPYRRIVFSGTVVPPLMRYYENTMVATSFSKDLSIPGERIGYVAVHPKAEGREALLSALVLANRILGFVNAPALMQRTVARCLEASVDAGIYERRRDLLAGILEEAGLEFVMPQGAFYFFPRSPLEDDTEFVRLLQEELVLAVPGRGFGKAGHVRLAFCVDESVIELSREGIKRAAARARGG